MKKRRAGVSLWVVAPTLQSGSKVHRTFALIDFLVLFHQGKRTKTFIPYYLPEGLSGKIVIRDIYGRNISEYEIVEGKNIIEINTRGWSNGVYIYGLMINGSIKKYKKMVLSKN